MTNDGGYDLKPDEQPPTPPPPPLMPETGAAPPPALPASSTAPASRPRPGEPGWVPPVPIIEKADPATDEPPPDPDVEKNKGLAILGYVCFLIPLAGAPNSKFARYHANQSLLATIYLMVAVVGIVIISFGWEQVGPHVTIAILSGFFACIFWVIRILMLIGWVALVFAGIINAANGEKKGLPVLGHWTLIK